MSQIETTRRELKFGWLALITALIGIMTSVVTLPFYMLGPLTKSLEAEFGWERTSIVAASSFIQMGSIIGMPIAGRLAIRIGGKETCLISILIMLAIMWSLAMWVDSVFKLYLGYFMLGLLCGGASPVTYTMLIGMWFDKARGFALGIALAGTGIAGFLAPILVQAVTAEAGWRAAILAITAIMAIGLPIVLVGYRERVVSDKTVCPDAKVRLTTGRELLAEPRFVLLAVILILGGSFISGVLIHLVPMLIETGFDPATAATTAALSGAALVIGRIFVGWLLDRLPAVWLGCGMFLLAGLGCFAFVIGGPDFAPLMVISLGMMVGAEMDLLSYLILRNFRLADYGVIYGYLYGAYMVGSIISPFVTGQFLNIGGYTMMFGAAGVMFGFIAILFPIVDLLGKPRLGPAETLA